MHVRHQHGHFEVCRTEGRSTRLGFLWRETDQSGKRVRRNFVSGTLEGYPTEELAQAAVNGLRTCTNSGNLYLTSLVSNNRTIGSWYLNALYRSGEFVRPSDEHELRKLLDKSFTRNVSYGVKGNMAFITRERDGGRK